MAHWPPQDKIQILLKSKFPYIKYKVSIILWFTISIHSLNCLLCIWSSSHTEVLPLLKMCHAFYHLQAFRYANPWGLRDDLWFLYLATLHLPFFPSLDIDFHLKQVRYNKEGWGRSIVPFSSSVHPALICTALTTSTPPSSWHAILCS